MLPVRLAKLKRKMSRKQMRICFLDHESLRAARALRIWLLMLLRVRSDYLWVIRCRCAGRSRVMGRGASVQRALRLVRSRSPEECLLC